MDRRKFIEIGAGAGAAGIVSLSSASCAPALPQMGSLGGSPGKSRQDLDLHLATLDRGLGLLAEANLAGSPTWPGYQEKNQLTRDALRTLYFSGMLGDLPIESQIAPQVQQRLWQMAPEVDSTVASMTDYLEHLTSSEWAELQLFLRYRNNPAMVLAEELTDHAAMHGMSRSRRLQTRAIITNTALRLRSQPPEAVVGEYLETMRKTADSDAVDAMARRNLAARLSEEAFWRHQDAASLPLAQPTPRGLRTMGWGLVIFAAGAVVVAAGAFDGVFVMTAGAVVMLVGLIQLLINAAFG